MTEPLIEPDDYNPEPPPRTKLGVALVVIGLQVLVALALIQAFAPNFAAKAVDTVISTFSVTVYTPPLPPPPPPPRATPDQAGKSGDAGKKAIAKPTTAKAAVPVKQVPSPVATNTGSADSSGAVKQGSGTGAGGPGNGTGSGAGGNGTGGGAAAKAVHISGQINKASDFPLPPGGREARIGKSVILALTVSPAGRATACRIYKPSGFAETDQVACRLAMDRLRFKPATNGAGQPVTSTFYWQQKFFF